MYIEERVKALEDERKELLKRVEELENNQPEKFMTVKQFAEYMGGEFSTNNLYMQIRKGKIKVKYIGKRPIIPMSQFTEKTKAAKPKTIEKKQPSLHDRVFT